MFKKRQFLAVFLLWSAALCCGSDKSNYNIAVIGDIHYDDWKYHDMSKIKHLGIPQSKYVYNKDGYYSWRNHSLWTEINLGGSLEKNTPLNIKMWEKNNSEYNFNRQRRNYGILYKKDYKRLKPRPTGRHH